MLQCVHIRRHRYSRLLILSSPAAIDDLRDVLHVTRSLKRWMDLGVELGLSYSTLEAIEVERSKRVNDCRRDMFVAWLRMRDKVSAVGEPSWSVLQAALRRMGEKGIADRIMVSCASMYIIVVVCAMKGLSFSYRRRRRRLAAYFSKGRGCMTSTEPSVSLLLHV